MAIATMGNERIIITGFMGSGKSTVGRALARLLECEMVDLDEVITHEDRAPWQIIEADGEPAFREIETRALGTILENHGARVIALGGGAWTLARNRELVTSARGISVWLDAPFNLCWQRIVAGDNERPLAPNKQEAFGRYTERRTAYASADVHVEVTENKTAEEMALEIVRSLAERPVGNRTKLA